MVDATADVVNIAHSDECHMYVRSLRLISTSLYCRCCCCCKKCNNKKTKDNAQEKVTKDWVRAKAIDWDSGGEKERYEANE